MRGLIRTQSPLKLDEFNRISTPTRKVGTLGTIKTLVIVD